MGTTDKVVSIDPAGSYDNGSLTVQTQVYQYLLNFPAGSTTLTPDAASKCDFDTPTTYTCTIKDGLKFANGHDLTASDVAFSFKRIVDDQRPQRPGIAARQHEVGRGQGRQDRRLHPQLAQ